MSKLQELYRDPVSEFRFTTLSDVARVFNDVCLAVTPPRLPHDFYWSARKHFAIDGGMVSLWFPTPLDADFEPQDIALYYRDIADPKKLAIFLELFCTALVAAQRGENEFKAELRTRRPWLWLLAAASSVLMAFVARRYAHG